MTLYIQERADGKYPTKKRKNHLKATLSIYRAENETRTRDPNLGKVVLYQLSYFRNKQKNIGEEKETRTPTTQLSLPPQSSASTNSAISPIKEQ